jgi:hypothetical protein
MYIPDLAHRRIKWQRDPEIPPLRLSHCNRIANMRKQLCQLIDDQIRVEIAAYALLHPPRTQRNTMPLMLPGKSQPKRTKLKIVHPVRSLAATA